MNYKQVRKYQIGEHVVKPGKTYNPGGWQYKSDEFENLAI